MPSSNAITLSSDYVVTPSSNYVVIPSSDYVVTPSSDYAVNNIYYKNPLAIPIHVLHGLSAGWNEVVELWSNGHYTGGVNLLETFLHIRIQ